MKNYNLIKDNVEYGTKMEIPWRRRLQKKYPSIRNKNVSNQFSSMDSISTDNGVIIEHEHKQRHMKHDQYYSIFFNRCKFDKSIQQLKRGIGQIYYWTCTDGLYFWEFYDVEKQKDQFDYGRNGNFKSGEGARNVVNIKVEYIKKYVD